MNDQTPLAQALVSVAPPLAGVDAGDGQASWRRRAVLAVNLATYAGLLVWMGSILGAGGFSPVDLVLLVCFAIATPWTVLGFWNAVIGLWLLHGARDGLREVAPFATDGSGPPALATAIIMTLRNEDPHRALLRLRTVKASLDATGYGTSFAYFILSDTSSPEVAAEEERLVARWRAEDADPDAIHYRRRLDNKGYKAGNVREFCETHGRSYDLMVPLDADSLMSGEAILRLVRIMESHPRIGILQSLVVGAPAASPFARIFQFGMRHGMRAYTMGSAWWIADCGPFWGHNAIVRIAPFAQFCHLPVLPGKAPLGGPIMSHDQVEAVMMRRAGYEVRVLPEEHGSWEENPPTVFDFSTRDLRWCQGNMQYLKLLAERSLIPGLLPMSRFQLAWAVLMFVGVPAMTLMIALAPLKVIDGEPHALFPASSAIALYVTFLLMYLSPKIAGFLDILVERGGVARYGGLGRFIAGVVVEVLFSFLLGAVTTFRIAVFVIGLAFGRSVIWNGQSRDAQSVPWSVAARGLWAVTLFGLAVCGALAWLAPTVLLWSLPLTLGYLTAIPFAVITASPALGAFLVRHRLCAIPEEFAPPAELLALRSRA